MTNPTNLKDNINTLETNSSIINYFLKRRVMIKYQESEEMYLETLLLLKEKKRAVHSVDIANELNYSRASVSRGVKLLIKKSYIEMAENGEIDFSTAGLKKAKDIYDRHCVITELLTFVGADKKIAEENACRIEHVISPKLFAVLKRFVNNNKK